MATTGVLEAFDAAKKEFLRDLPDSEKSKFSTLETIEDVYDATDQIQKEQAKSGTLRNLRKIQPYLDCLNHYADVIETFVQAKAEILALIWGPIKLILLISSTYIKSYDKILDCMSHIGDTLPRFENYRRIFQDNETIKHVLCLFYRDILDFHTTAIHFFGRKKWRIFFESIWPRYAGKISLIRQNMERHRLLLDSEVNLAHITEAHTARLQAYKEYEEMHEFQQRQDFASIKSSLNPQLYDQELERISEDCIGETGRWLETQDAFRAWSDPHDIVHRVLWLEGIPGAGKTYLSSRTVQHMKTTNAQVIFAFLSYRSSQTISTLKLLHSFIFQFVYENPGLRPILCQAVEAKYRQVGSSVEYNKELLKNLVEEQSVFIIIDGLDEITELERGSLLKTLLQLLNDCPNLKLLVSSRGDHDILKLLKPHAEVVRVHIENSNDIDEYVKRRIDSWLSTLVFDTRIISEIRRLLRLIATKAKGMFLYARLVLDNIESQSNLDQVRNEANNLPDGLYEAYGRIIARIDALRPRERKEARTILEWVGCSSFPLTENQIQFAVSVSSGVDPSKGNQESFLNILQRCGPIIEIIEEIVQFVHFTAKEYLFSKQSDHYFDVFDCNRNIALTSVNYLSSNCFDQSLSDDDVRERILSGAYILESYAAGQWLQHVKKSVEQNDGQLDFEFCRSIHEFVFKRANAGFVHPLVPREAQMTPLKLFEEDQPALYETLRDIDFFLIRRQREVSLRYAENWDKCDPLTVSATEARNFETLSSMLCSSQNHRKNCPCAELRRNYGLRLFKCDRPGCSFFRTGFETRKERDRHCNAHTRPFKCPVLNCDFADVGFVTRSSLNIHMSKIHGHKLSSKIDSICGTPSRSQTMPLSGAPATNGIQSIDANIVTSERTSRGTNGIQDLELLLVEAVKSNNFDYINEYWRGVPRLLRKLLRVSIKHASVDMLELLLKACGDVREVDRYLLNYAAKYNNLQAAQMVLEKGAVIRDHNSRCRHSDLYYAILNRSPEMIKLLLAQGCRDVADGFEKLLPPSKDVAAEEAAMHCFQLLEGARSITDQQLIRACFKGNATKSFSIPIAQLLLKHGAEVDSSITPGYTPLYFASGNESLKAAEFMKFLLQSGAKPPKAMERLLPIRDRPGPRNISRWLGMTWDELVDEYAPMVEEAADQAADQVSDQADDQALDDRDHSYFRDEENNSTESYYQKIRLKLVR